MPDIRTPKRPQKKLSGTKSTFSKQKNGSSINIRTSTGIKGNSPGGGQKEEETYELQEEFLEDDHVIDSFGALMKGTNIDH